MNYMKDVANILGVELDEEFLVDDFDCRFKITDNGLLFYQDKDWERSMLQIDMLRGKSIIKKLPWKPKYTEKYYYPCVYTKKVSQFTWGCCTFEYSLLALGMVYRTQEEAEANFKSDYEKLTGEKL